MEAEILKERLTALEESEMQMFRYLLGMPDGIILTAETDIILAKLLMQAGVAVIGDDNLASIPQDIRDTYRNIWSDELTLRWRKRNWMYKCIETCKYLYGVMTWEVLGKLFGLRYPHAEMAEIREIFSQTPENLQWFTERGDRLVLNGFEKDDYYETLERQIQRYIPYYIPTKEEVEELYEQGSLISREAHAKLQKYIAETFECSMDTASLKIHELYEAVNNRIKIGDAADSFANTGAGERNDFAFPSDEEQVRFLELYIEMSRECRIRDNRGHDYYEMVAIMAEKNRAAGSADKDGIRIRRVKTGRNDPCPCGSGKKYKNCCGRS